MFKKKNIFQAIDKLLSKKGHEEVLSLFLDDYTGNSIFIRFDYVNKVSAYKLVWVDLNYIDLKHLDAYINMQFMTSVLANKVAEILEKIEYDSCSFVDDRIVGDIVSIVSYQKEKPYEYTFSRFLPKELSFLVDPLVILFSYLPRNMNSFLNEIFAKLDGKEEKYNALKPITFHLFEDTIDSLFQSKVLKEGKKLFADDRISFLEKINDKYMALFSLEELVILLIRVIDENHILYWCSCSHEGFCKHLYPVLQLIRKGVERPFYKVKYNGEEKSLLDKVTDGEFNLCCGVENDCLFLINNEGDVLKVPFIKNGKSVFEVLEDDDLLSLSNYIEDMQKK